MACPDLASEVIQEKRRRRRSNIQHSMENHLVLVKKTGSVDQY
jgi:hypothetical protein